jgi:pimeloyl-ACP methyl ester carboxylesterase
VSLGGCRPFGNPQGGAAKGQQATWDALLAWEKPVNFIWGGSDAVFTEEWGRDWASRYAQATFDLIQGAGHFLQETAGGVVAELFLQKSGAGH